MSGKAKRKAEVKKPEKKELEKVSPEVKKEIPALQSSIDEITEKINGVKTMEELEALTGRVHELWPEEIPVEVQELAAKRGEEIENEKPEAKKVISKDDLQSGWKKVTMEEVKKAEGDGKLIGFDDITMTADIKE